MRITEVDRLKFNALHHAGNSELKHVKRVVGDSTTRQVLIIRLVLVYHWYLEDTPVEYI